MKKFILRVIDAINICRKDKYGFLEWKYFLSYLFIPSNVKYDFIKNHLR